MAANSVPTCPKPDLSRLWKARMANHMTKPAPLTREEEERLFRQALREVTCGKNDLPTAADFQHRLNRLGLPTLPDSREGLGPWLLTVLALLEQRSGISGPSRPQPQPVPMRTVFNTAERELIDRQVRRGTVCGAIVSVTNLVVMGWLGLPLGIALVVGGVLTAAGRLAGQQDGLGLAEAARRTSQKEEADLLRFYEDQVRDADSK